MSVIGDVKSRVREWDVRTTMVWVETGHVFKLSGQDKPQCKDDI
jgi:hypothetical protein